MTFDLNLLRSAVTLLSFVAFLCIVAWAYAGRNKQRFEAQAGVPLLDDGFEAEGVRHE